MTFFNGVDDAAVAASGFGRCSCSIADERGEPATTRVELPADGPGLRLERHA